MELMRGVPAPLMAALSGPYFHPVALVYLDWPGAPVRAHSGRGTITWGGHSWLGVGSFGGINLPEEVMTAVPEEFEMSLITDFPDIEPYTDIPIRGRVGQVFLGATTTPGGNNLIGAVEMCSGSADGLAMQVEVGERDGKTVTAFQISVTMTTGPSMRSDVSISHSDEDQRRAYPDDTAGRHLILSEAKAQKTRWPE